MVDFNIDSLMERINNPILQVLAALTLIGLYAGVAFASILGFYYLVFGIISLF